MFPICKFCKVAEKTEICINPKKGREKKGLQKLNVIKRKNNEEAGGAKKSAYEVEASSPERHYSSVVSNQSDNELEDEKDRVAEGKCDDRSENDMAMPADNDNPEMSLCVAFNGEDPWQCKEYYLG